MQFLAEDGKIVVAGKMDKPDAVPTLGNPHAITNFQGLSDLAIHGEPPPHHPLHNLDFN